MMSNIYAQEVLNFDFNISDFLWTSNGQSVRKLPDQFQCGKSTVSGILKKQNDYLEQFEEIEKPNAKRLNKASFSEELNKAVYDWFTRVRTQNVFYLRFK